MISLATPSLRHAALALIFIAGATLLVGCDSNHSHGADESHGAAMSAHESHGHDEEAAPDEAHGHDETHGHDEAPQAAKMPTSLDELPDGVNVVQFEMQHLTAAMQNILLHIANDQLDNVPKEIGKVHPIYELTTGAINDGHYKPPHNADQIDAFKRLDGAFHDDLVTLVRASKKNDLPAATAAYGKLVDGCTNCHSQFRFAPTAQ